MAVAPRAYGMPETAQQLYCTGLYQLSWLQTTAQCSANALLRSQAHNTLSTRSISDISSMRCQPHCIASISKALKATCSCVVCCCRCRTVCLYLCRDDRSVILLAQPFGYGQKGHITITLKKLSLYRRHDQADQDFSLKNLGIILSDTESQGKLESYLRSGKCPLQDSELRIFTFDTPEVQNVLTGEQDAAQLDIDVKIGGLASLFFINCEAGMPASFAAKVEQYNLVAGRKDYLAVGETELDVMYWVGLGRAVDEACYAGCKCFLLVRGHMQARRAGSLEGHTMWQHQVLGGWVAGVLWLHTESS